MKKEVSVLNESFTVFLDSEHGHVPVIIEDVLLEESDNTAESNKLKIKHKLDWDNKKFPEQYKNLKLHEAAELRGIIETAIHEVFRKLLEAEAKENG